MMVLYFCIVSIGHCRTVVARAASVARSLVSYHVIGWMAFYHYITLLYARCILVVAMVINVIMSWVGHLTSMVEFGEYT